MTPDLQNIRAITRRHFFRDSGLGFGAIALQALLAKLPEISIAAVEAALKAHLPERHHKLLPKNYEALKRGYEEAKKQIPVAA